MRFLQFCETFEYLKFSAVSGDDETDDKNNAIKGDHRHCQGDHRHCRESGAAPLHFLSLMKIPMPLLGHRVNKSSQDTEIANEHHAQIAGNCISKISRDHFP